MSGAARYSTPAALRTALEQHLRRMAQADAVPLDRLRKEVASGRFLARLAAVAPAGSWALKGGQALIARLGPRARATRDADATWRLAPEGFAAVVASAAALDLGDGFRFELATARETIAETDEGGVRHSLLALLDGREFERLRIDVSLVPGDLRPFDMLALRDLLGFAGIAAPRIPVVPIGQHLAEKLHALTRDYGAAGNSRSRDLFDMLVIAAELPVPALGALRGACRATFDLRRTSWPPALTPPPPTWVAPWRSYVADLAAPWRDLAAATRALEAFWRPVIDGDESDDDAAWDGKTWAWAS